MIRHPDPSRWSSLCSLIEDQGEDLPDQWHPLNHPGHPLDKPKADPNVLKQAKKKRSRKNREP